MTANKTGLLIHFDEDRRSGLIQEKDTDNDRSFSDALGVHGWEIGQLSIAFLCFSNTTIDYIALAKKGRKVATEKSRIVFYDIVTLNSIPIKNIESKLSDRLQRYFIKASQGIGGAIPDDVWLALVEAIKSERPKLVDEINRLLSLRLYSGFHLYGESAEILSQEREALGISLDIFSGSNQLRERVLSEWAPHENSVEQIDEAKSTAKLTRLKQGQSAFIAGISQCYLQEDSAIQHDLFNWKGMSPIHEAGVSVFKQGKRELQVIYANRNHLERTLGVDLIYYNKSYELFVLVQYKLMREEGYKFLYRPDEQFVEELARMDDHYNLTRSTAVIRSHSEYRLNDDGFMVKLVPNRGLWPASGELIKGMYIPREYMHFLLSSNGPKGPQGGTQITFEGAPRYLTNSQFVDNVRDGWIGSRGVQSQTIKSMIKNFYETGRALMVAYES